MDLQLEKFSLPMSYYFQMECRRWAPTCRCGWSSGFLLVILMDVGLTGWAWSTGYVGMRVSTDLFNIL